MMHPHSPIRPQLAVPGIGFPQNFLVAQDVLESRAFRDWSDDRFDTPRSRSIASPGVRHRGSGWRLDGEMVAAASGQTCTIFDVLSLMVGGTQRAGRARLIQKNSGLPQA
jgi:hypothetical protein